MAGRPLPAEWGPEPGAKPLQWVSHTVSSAIGPSKRLTKGTVSLSRGQGVLQMAHDSRIDRDYSWNA